MDYKKIYKKIEKRYIIWFIVLILLSVSRQIIIQYEINHGKDMSKVINISGRQRMLSQKISKEVLLIEQSQDKDILDTNIKDLKSSLQILEDSHYNLKKEENIKNSKKIVELFEEIDPYYINIVESGNRILDLAEKDEINNRFLLKEIEIINKNEKTFLEKMDKIVYQYEIESKNTVLIIEKTELVLFFLVLAILGFISIFVFFPAAKTLRYAFIDINESNENIKKIFSTMKDPIFLIHLNGDIITKNEDAKKIMNSNKALNGRYNIKRDINWLDLEINKIIDIVKIGQKVDNLEVKIKDINGDIRTLVLSVVDGRYNNEYVILINLFEITAQKKAEELLRDMAIRDELTDLYNRHFLETIISKEVNKVDRYKNTFSIAILDLDNFKKINDKWGHPVGDLVLKEVAKTLREKSRISDYLFRVGGEEFIIIMPETNLEGAYIAAEKIRIAIEENNNIIVGRYTASFGVAEIKDNESYGELYSRVDDALYKAKRSGKNIVLKSN